MYVLHLNHDLSQLQKQIKIYYCQPIWTHRSLSKHPLKHILIPLARSYWTRSSDNQMRSKSLERVSSVKNPYTAKEPHNIECKSLLGFFHSGLSLAVIWLLSFRELVEVARFLKFPSIACIQRDICLPSWIHNPKLSLR